MLSKEQIEGLNAEQRQAYREYLDEQVEKYKKLEKTQESSDQSKFEKFQNQFIKTEGLDGIPYDELVEQMSSGEMKRKKDEKRMRGEI